MGKYGQASLDAVRKLKVRNGQAQNPPVAWDKATSSFPSTSQDKSCPKTAFLGLCEAGMVKRVAPGTYTRSRKNKKYAVKAAYMLKASPSLVNLGEKGLWQKVMRSLGEPVNKVQNQQMDVVLSLFQNGLIR
jgi:hypothetical protein